MFVLRKDLYKTNNDHSGSNKGTIQDLKTKKSLCEIDVTRI